MKIISVKATNFRSYKSISWKLTSSGLTLIDGENLDTGRSNMTGKTTLIDSVFWGLYGWLPKWGGSKGGSADAVITRGEKKCIVEVIVEHNGSRFVIERERPAKLRVSHDGVALQGKSSDLDDRIEELLGMSASQFLISVYVSQDRSSSFFTMTDTERTNLLSTIAGLEHLNRGLERAKAKKQELELHSRTVSSAQSITQASLDRFPEEKKSGLLTIDTYKAEANDIKRSIEVRESSNNVSKTVIAKFGETMLADIMNKTDAKLAINSASYIAAQSELALKKTMSTISQKPESELVLAVSTAKGSLILAENANISKQTIRNANIRIQDQINAIIKQLEQPSKTGYCNDCGQVLPEENREAHMNKLIEKADGLATQIQPEELNVPTENFKHEVEEAQRVLSKRTAELDIAPSIARGEIRIIESQMDQLFKEAADIVASQKRELSDLNKKQEDFLKELDRFLYDLNKDYNHKTELLKNAQESMGRINIREHECQVEFDKYEDQHKKLLQEMDETLDLIDLFGPKGFRSVCFDGIIERISDRASQLLLLMTDDVYSTRIEQAGETSKGEGKVFCVELS